MDREGLINLVLNREVSISKLKLVAFSKWHPKDALSHDVNNSLNFYELDED